MPKPCGTTVEKLWIVAGKKCVRLFTVCYLTALSWASYVGNSLVYPLQIPRFAPRLSPGKLPAYTPVDRPVFPTIHSTYNHHHEFKKEG